MSLYFTVLGCSSATPTASRHPSAFLLRSSKCKHLFLIDCGEGTQMQIRRKGVYLQKISHVFISHLHGDHFLGLMGLLFSQNLLGRKEPLHVYAHKPLKKLIQLTLSMDKTVLQFPLEFHPIKAGSSILFEDENIAVKAFPLSHSIITHGFVFREKGYPFVLNKDFVTNNTLTTQDIRTIKNGGDYVDDSGLSHPNKEIAIESKHLNSFAYCSDTLFDPKIIKHIKGVDLLYHEATFMQELEHIAKEKGHSTTIDAATIANMAKVKTLVIGHYSARYKNLSPLIEEAKTVFKNTIAAVEGSVIEL